jgi:hypothetical protein
MKVGLSISPEFAQDEAPIDAMRERLELVRAAREAGIHSVTMGEHYLSTPHPCFQNIPFLARVATEAEGMDVYAFRVLHPDTPSGYCTAGTGVSAELDTRRFSGSR